MEPEDIDKLFNERLGKMAPTPPADLWNRLQERMQEEMPQAAPVPQLQPEEHQEKRRFGFIYYSIAAAIALLLAVGVVLKFQQPQTVTDQTIAQVDVTGKADATTEETIVTEPAPEQTIAAVTPDETIAEPTITEDPTIDAEPETAVANKPTSRKAAPKATDRWVKVETAKQPAAMLAKQTTKPATPEAIVEPTVATHTPVSFASAKSAEPVEIIIKRSVTQENVALASAAEPEENSSFQRKQNLAKNIFKQVKNLSNGEKVNLEEVGLSADRIALETKIGKQKISKVINL